MKSVENKSIKLRTSLMSFIIFIIFLSNILTEVNSLVGSGVDCNVMLPLAGVVCVSEQGYKLSLNSQTTNTCRVGTVCADYPEICVNHSQPACETQRCRVCPPGAISTCYDLKTYAACLDGQLSTTIRNCQASRPYCSVVYQDGFQTASCTNIIGDAACTTIPPTPEPEPEPDTCTKIGRFPIKSDPTCQKYYYCYLSGGEFFKVDYKCHNDTVFHPLKDVCVTPGSYQCK